MWITTKNKKYGVAVYNYKGDTRYGLPLEIGETVQVLEECTGWYRGFSTKNRSIKGIFPISYVCLKPCRVDNEGLFECVVPQEDAVVREVTLVLREWGIIWKKLYVERETYKFTTLRKVMRELLEWRRQLLTGTLTQDQTRELKLKITAKIDWGNRKLGMDLVPRVGATMVDPATMSVVELYQVHVQSSENSQGASARGTLKRKEARKVLTHHLYFCMRDFGHHVGEDTEIYFSLFDTSLNAYISERFLVKISKEGFSNYVEKLHSNCTIFTDLGNADLSRDIYLVAHVMRMGRMLYSDSVKKASSSHPPPPPHQLFKRPHGVAVINISEVLLNKDRGEGAAANEEKEFTFKVYQGDEKDYHQIHEFIIKKQSNKFNPLSGQPNYGIVISLRMLHGELTQVREENPLIFKNVSLTKKLGFSDVIMPGDVRNDLYLTLDRGEFERGGKSTGKNIEVTILVLDGEGKILEDCLWGASGTDGANDYQSMIVYHHNQPSWAETLRLAVPIDKFYGSHIRLEYRHCSTRDKTDNKKLFGFSFARLMESGGATIRDGQHDLHIYKCEERARLEPPAYLGLPASARDVPPAHARPPAHPFNRSAKEGVTVHTLLCSTKLTQNVDLLSLLQWKEHPEHIQEALGRILRLPGEELVKFLQDVLDALFSMFSTEDGNSTTHSGLVFHALVSIFSLLDDSKFEHFKPVMDAYIKGHFAAALVYKGLLSSVQHCADWVSSTEKQEPIQKCFRSLEYIFKFIIQSRLLFARATGGQYEDSFRRDLYNVFNALNKMLSTSYDVILPTQVALLHSISAVYEQLTEVLPVTEITQLATGMLESLPVRDLPPQLTQAKLTAIRNMVTSKLFTDDESRNALLGTACKHLRCHLAHRDELRLCTEILSEVLGFLFRQRQAQAQGKVNNCLHHDVEILCVTTLDMLIQTVLIIIDRSTAVLGCLVACLIGLLQLLDEFHYKRLWEELGDRKPQKDFLLRVFLVFRDLVKMETVFPNDWLVIKMVANNVMLYALQELAQPLVFQFLDTRGHFDSQLWSNYFNLAVAFLTQPSLQLEKFSEVKREKIVEKYGDMRVLMGFQILSMWSNLGDHKIHFIPSMVGPFLEVTLVPESELRKATLFIFFDMMECEQKKRGNFKQVESELIDKLDILISENKGDDEYRQLFNTILLDRVQSEDPAWKETGSAFISSVTRLLERLLDYRSVIQGDENRDKRMSCTVNLLNFYKNEINRKEMYLRYIYKLHDLHLAADNYTEAGFTLKLYSDALSWSAEPLVADALHPAQLHWQRKELLYIKMINYFDKGKCWEQGIPLCKELAELYERRLFDYSKLSHILRTQAKFFDNILTQLRPEPEYFRVGFYGLSFPLFVRNKLFVYRGLEYERISAFTQRLQTEFPSAQILMKNSPPDDSIVNSDGQFIQICNVKPIPDDSRAADLPDKIASYYQVNDVRRFQLDRPVHKGAVDKDNEFKSLWIERTTLTTASPLPGILRWFEVTDRAQEDVPPVLFACHTMESVNKELRNLVSQYTAEPRRNINPFSMRLQGIIDANVMGGITKYQLAFFSPEFAQTHPEFSDHIYRLKALTVDQVQVLESGLLLHGQLAPSGVQPLHRRLLERFAQLKAGLRELASTLTRPRASQESIVNTPLPPLPTEKCYSAQTNLYTNRLSHSSGGLASADDDDIYSKPMEQLEGMAGGGGETTPPPIPYREARPKSAGYSCTTPDQLARTPTRGTPDYSSMPPMRSSRECLDEVGCQSPRALKPTHQRSHSKPLNMPSEGGAVSSPQRNSWSESTAEEAPPLPPRGQTPDKRNTNLFLDTSQTPPAPPKRLVKKGSSGVFSLDSAGDPAGDGERNGDLRDSGFAEFPSSSSSSVPSLPTPTNNFNNMSYEEFQLPPHGTRHGMNIAPPPVPPKVVCLPPSVAGAGAAEGGRTPAEERAAAVENYSVPRLMLPQAQAGDGPAT